MTYLRLPTVFILFLLLAMSWSEAQDRQRPFGRGLGGGLGSGRGGGFGRGLDKLTLVRSDQVQEDIGTTAKQKQKIDLAVEVMNKKLGDLRSGFRDLSREERAQRIAEVRALRRELNQKATEMIATFLSEQQNQRIDQILLQQRGARALVDKDLQDKLEISGNQGDRISTIFQEQDEAMREMFQGVSRDDQRQLFSQVRDMRTEAEAQALGVLTKQQSGKFKQLMGEPFELDRRSLFGGFGGGRGGFGEGRGRGFGGGRGRRGAQEEPRVRPPAEL